MEVQHRPQIWIFWKFETFKDPRWSAYYSKQLQVTAKIARPPNLQSASHENWYASSARTQKWLTWPKDIAPRAGNSARWTKSNRRGICMVTCSTTWQNVWIIVNPAPEGLQTCRLTHFPIHYTWNKRYWTVLYWKSWCFLGPSSSVRSIVFWGGAEVSLTQWYIPGDLAHIENHLFEGWYVFLYEFVFPRFSFGFFWSFFLLSSSLRSDENHLRA